MAYACRAHGLPLVIYASVNANPLKIKRMQALGADVRLEGDDFDAAKEAAKQHAADISGWMVEDGLEAAISEGHGSLAIELLAYREAFDAFTLPLGNGAMLAGMARWWKAASPHTQVLGVCATDADAMEKSWRENRVVVRETAATIADGIAVRVPVPVAVEDLQGLIEDVLLVDDEHIKRAMRLAYRHAGLILEPAGAVGVAAIVAHPARFAQRRIATVLCGSNATEAQIDQFCR
jgi:threonine dehydratase